MTTQHTPGRLAHKGSYIYAPGEGGFDVYNTDDDEANARRLVACWNACEGISTESIEAYGHRFKYPLKDLFLDMEQNEKRLITQRDELLTALKTLMGMLDDDIKTSTDEQLAFGLADPQCPEHIKSELACVIACRAAIAKAEGGAT